MEGGSRAKRTRSHQTGVWVGSTCPSPLTSEWVLSSEVTAGIAGPIQPPYIFLCDPFLSEAPVSPHKGQGCSKSQKTRKASLPTESNSARAENFLKSLHYIPFLTFGPVLTCWRTMNITLQSERVLSGRRVQTLGGGLLAKLRLPGPGAPARHTTSCVRGRGAC